MNNFAERIYKCFTAGYSQSVGLQDITGRLLSLNNVNVELESETDNTALYNIFKIGGDKIATVAFSTDNDGTMSVTEYNENGNPYNSINAVSGNYSDLFNKLVKIIKNRIPES